MPLTNKQVCENFVRYPGTDCQNGKRSLFVENDTLFSYGHHYEVARYVRAKKCFLVREMGDSSATTNRHVSQANTALRVLAAKPVIQVPGWLPGPRGRLDPGDLCHSLRESWAKQGIELPHDAYKLVKKLHLHEVINTTSVEMLLGQQRPRYDGPAADADPWDAIEGVV